MTDFSHFSPALFDFLAELSLNNNREWFNANKQRYEDTIREPARAFVRAMGARLDAISEHFVADDRRMGGSLMRVYRDTRFGKDKTPYKTNVGIQFRHAAGKDVHAPGFYLHISLDEIFLGAGMWRPAKEPLKQIRDRIATQPETWQSVLDSEGLKTDWRLGGESLSRGPRGFDKSHPMIEELKRKDFIAVRDLGPDAVTDADLPDRLMAMFQQTTPLVKWLCAATGAAY